MQGALVEQQSGRTHQLEQALRIAQPVHNRPARLVLGVVFFNLLRELLNEVSP